MKILFNFLKFIINKIFSFIIYLILLIILFVYIFSIYGKEKEINRNYQNLSIENISNPKEDKLASGFNFLDDETHTFKEVLDALKNASNDDNIQNILINIDTISFLPSQIEELIPLFNKLKEKGKKIISYGSSLNNNSYSIALLADEIIVDETENVDITIGGYNKNLLYYKNLFDKFGFKMEVIHIGDFKSFGEEYRENVISSELKQTLIRINDNRLENFINRISLNRKLDYNSVKEKLLNGKYSFISPKLARDLSLVDNLMPYDEMAYKYNIKIDNTISINEYIMNNRNSVKHNDNIAVIYLDGNIEEKPSNPYSPFISFDNFEEKLERALAINNLAGVVIRINSNGGSAYVSKKIYENIRYLDFPVYVSISNTAASGGYYIASSADRIFSNNASLTGSIGVVSMFPKYIGSLEKFNINNNTVSRGKYVDLTNPLVPLKENDKLIYKKRLENIYKEFKNDILVKREMLNENELEKIAQGKIWLGDEAVKIKLVDEIGTLYDSIEKLAESLELENYNVIDIYSKQNLYDYKEMIKFNFLPFFKTNNVIIDELTKKFNFLMNNKEKPLYYSNDIEVDF